MMNINKIEEVRIQSQLSERIHFVENDEKYYLCISGIILPYNFGVIMLVWTLSGRRYFSRLIDHNENELKHIQLLNQSNEAIQDNSKLIIYLMQVFQRYVFQSSIDQLSEIIPIDIPALN